MSSQPPAEEPKPEPESHLARAYYASTRQPSLESITFYLALIPAVLEALRSFGFSLTNHPAEGRWLLLLRWITCLLFLLLDSFLANTPHPVPIPLGPLHPKRIYEKFALQDRAWQLLLVLLLPITASLIALLFYIPSAR